MISFDRYAAEVIAAHRTLAAYRQLCEAARRHPDGSAERVAKDREAGKMRDARTAHVTALRTLQRAMDAEILAGQCA